MAKRCVICNKGTISGNNVSHANNRTKKKIKPNLQKVKILYKGSPKRVWVCTSCLKSGKVTKVA